ncbi:hypothetical protein [Bdellovibrio bacteriovorus]|uniref:hypothetical protein n=1 Tax=Bdellovibrio TaxID=958 RepID=UPI0035A93B8C
MFPVLLNLLKTSDESSATRRRQQDFQSLITTIRLEINDGVACGRLLGSLSQTINPTLINVEQPLRINTSYANQPGPLQDGWRSNESDITIEKIAVIVKKRALDDSGNPRVVTLDWPPFIGALNKYEAEIVITPKDIPWKSQAAERRIPIYLNVLPISATLARIHQCFGPGSLAEACEAVGGAFDGVNSPMNLRCNPDLRCMNSNQGIVTNPAVCASPYIANYVGTFSGTQQYICTWCNRNR